MKTFLTYLALAAGLLAATAPLAPARAQMLAVSGNGTTFNVAANTLLSVAGGPLVIQSGGTLNNAGTVAFTGDFTNAGTIGPGTGLWRATGTGAQYLKSTGAGLVEKLDVANANAVQLAGPFAAHFVSLAGGTLSLNAFDLTLTGGAADVNSQHFIVTNSGGQLRQAVGNASTSFPVGPNQTTYRPLFLKRQGGSAVYGARVAPAVGSPGPVLATHGVSLRWYVAAPDAAPYDLTVQWLATDELPGFNRQLATVARLNGNSYVASTYGPATNGSPYNLTGSNFRAGGQFAVFDRQSVLPVRNADPATTFSLLPFPNPTHGSFALRTSGPVPPGLVVSLFAADGRLVWQQPATEALLRGTAVPIDNLATGVYLLRYQATDGSAGTQRLGVE